MGRRGFTLAEVLITLGIIGVVAALTIPALIQNQQKKAWVSGLQKGYATMSQAIKLAMADDQTDDFSQTELFKICNGGVASGELLWTEDEEGNRTSNYDVDACGAILGKYVKQVERIKDTGLRSTDAAKHGWTNTSSNCPANVIGKEAWYFLNNKNKCEYIGVTTSFKLLNSMTVIIDPYINGSWSYGNIYIDVNGEKGPNTIGRDRFNFVISQDSVLVPSGSNNYAGGRFYWRDNATSACPGGTNTVGAGCAARIIEEGWKMNY